MDIHDWWRRSLSDNGTLKLSSRRLMIVLGNLKDDSAFAKAYRDDWSQEEYVEVGILNELRLMRCDNVAMHAQKQVEPFVLKSPAQLRADEDDSENKRQIRGGIMAQLMRPTTE